MFGVYRRQFLARLAESLWPQIFVSDDAVCYVSAALDFEWPLSAIGLEPLADAQVERCDVRLDRFEPAQLHRQEEAVMLLDPPVKRQNQIGALAAQLAFGESGHRLGRGLAFDQRPEHRATGYAEDVAHDARQLDVGGL